MVGISHDWIWSEWIGDLINESVCMCCRMTRINRSPIDNKRNWVRGHIIPNKKDHTNNKKMPEMIENIWPICPDCNDKDQSFPTNLHYAVYLGTMTKDEMEKRLLSIRKCLDDAVVKTCVRQRCKNVAHGKAIYCRVHESGVTPADLYHFLLTVKSGVREKLKKLDRLERDPFWRDDPEFLQLYRDETFAEIRMLKSFGISIR